VLVTLGKVPSEHLLGRDVAITSEAGSVESVALDGARVDVLLCLHPAATLYDRSQRDAFEQVIEKAATMAGSGDQSTLGSF
jgi:DNA polymerase